MYTFRVPIIDHLWWRDALEAQADRPETPEERGESPPDRREDPRFTVPAKDTRVLWKDGQPCRVVLAEIADISRGGAKILTNRPLRKDAKAHLELGSEADDDDEAWLDASVVEVLQIADGRWAVRLKFDSQCSVELLARLRKIPVLELADR
jgi:PilZ domain